MGPSVAGEDLMLPQSLTVLHGPVSPLWAPLVSFLYLGL